jgi:arylformamidase
MPSATGELDPGLEAEYNNRAAVPEHPQIFAAWEQRSERFRSRWNGRLELPYGPGARETLDLFPAATGQAPLHVFIHGGYWQAMDKRLFSFVAEALAESGVTVAVLNYPLCPQASIEEILHSVRRACVWLWHHAREAQADPRRMQICGHSAGGHLAAMLMATEWRREASGLPPDLIKSAIGISGLFELEPLRHTTINQALRLDAEAARRNSPALLEPVTRAPLLLVVGARESSEYHRQSRVLASAWGRHGAAIEVQDLPGHNHFTILDELCAADGAIATGARRLLAA